MKRRLEVQVKPNSKESSFEEQADGTWIARVKARPIDGKANAALIVLIADHFRIRQADVEIQRGNTSRRKCVEVELPE